MSLNPIESINALVGKTVRFCERDLCLTNASMIAISALGFEAETLANPMMVWAIIWSAWTPPQEIIRELRSPGFGLAPIVKFCGEFDREAWKSAPDTAAALLDTYNASLCRFDDEDSSETELGGWVSTAALLLREYGVSIDDFFAMPVARTNALCAAACERAGMAAVDTYRTRERAPALSAFLESANFDKPAKVRINTR